MSVLYNKAEQRFSIYNDIELLSTVVYETKNIKLQDKKGEYKWIGKIIIHKGKYLLSVIDKNTKMLHRQIPIEETYMQDTKITPISYTIGLPIDHRKTHIALRELRGRTFNSQEELMDELKVWFKKPVCILWKTEDFLKELNEDKVELESIYLTNVNIIKYARI